MTHMTQTTQPKIAVIGCGHWGKNHLKAFSSIGALGALFDAHADTAQSFATQYGVPTLQWAEILASSSIDGVVLATPASTHADLAEQALRAGKHVLIEKPMALTIHDAERIIAVADTCNRQIMVGHILRYHPAFQMLENLYKSGKIGTIQHIYSHRLSLGKLRAEEDVLWSFAPHDLSMILALTEQEPNKVECFKSTFLQNDIADSALLHLSFDNGMTAHIHTSWVHPFKEQRLVVTGTKGMFVFDDTQTIDKKLAFYAHLFDSTTSPPTIHKADIEYIAFQESEPLQNEAAHFVACIAENKSPITNGTEGLAVLKILAQTTETR